MGRGVGACEWAFRGGGGKGGSAVFQDGRGAQKKAPLVSAFSYLGPAPVPLQAGVDHHDFRLGGQQLRVRLRGGGSGRGLVLGGRRGARVVVVGPGAGSLGRACPTAAAAGQLGGEGQGIQGGFVLVGHGWGGGGDEGASVCRARKEMDVVRSERFDLSPSHTFFPLSHPAKMTTRKLGSGRAGMGGWVAHDLLCLLGVWRARGGHWAGGRGGAPEEA